MNLTAFTPFPRLRLSRSLLVFYYLSNIIGAASYSWGKDLTDTKIKLQESEKQLEHASSSSDQPSLVDQLMSYHGNAEEFASLLERAGKAGIAHQILLEARFLYAVDQQPSALPQLIPEFEAISSHFSIDQSKIFSTHEDFLAVIEYCRAMAALEKNNDLAFKKHICEAFWLSPSQAGAYAPSIEKLRLARYLETATIDTNQVLDGLTTSNKQSLSEILTQSPAILLHFWSPWNHNDDHEADHLNEISKIARKHQLFTASVLIDSSEEIVSAAKTELNAKPKMEQWIQWLERGEHKIATSLRVTDLPTIVMLNAQGKVLYHGGIDVIAIEKRILAMISEKNAATCPSPAATSSP